jgi:bifunctional ADP-heptose synthase (sugar kinase/adenylyltransferase)
VDTRHKILNLAQAAEAVRRDRGQRGPIRLVTGCFDPLLCDHAERLKEIAKDGGTLVVAVTDPARPLLGGRARAELAAALAVVDYVVFPVEDPMGSGLDGLGAVQVFREEAADEARTRELIAYVHRRQPGK